MKSIVSTIFIAFLILVAVTFVIYGQIKASEAEKNLVIAESMHKLAEEQARAAQAQFQEQEKQLNKLKEELKQCQNK